ncbi:DUF7552 domain-containing protein [Haloplanus pelagicus]|jgi:hypothetical protein|uniref:DUF7552 domain-containing protein n=1 Tax=Haloplanus pelagicus TaxID=2949995 RepID=UPI00203E5381|nr:hypothetical protein [Haloplanus sp. HW8-1]
MVEAGIDVSIRGRHATIRETRGRIEALAEGGRYRVASARTGMEPVPVVGLRYPDRETAATAARLTRAYRAALRRWDPALALVDPVVRESRSASASHDTASGQGRLGATSAGRKS